MRAMLSIFAFWEIFCLRDDYFTRRLTLKICNVFINKGSNIVAGTKNNCQLMLPIAGVSIVV